MAHIRIKKGLNIPLEGIPEGSEAESLSPSNLVALDLSSFDLRFSLLRREGDEVLLGEPIAEDRNVPGRMFLSPAGGFIKEIVRGLKRKILYIVIERNSEEKFFEHQALDLSKATKEEIVSKLMQGGIFSRLRRRPCNILPSPNRLPESIFIRALESAPFSPPAAIELKGFEKEFQYGLDALAKLAPVHLVYHEPVFADFKGVHLHSAEGPHPIGNSSVHIAELDPILSPNRCIWTGSVHDVICLGKLLITGRVHESKVISVAGEGIVPEKRGFFKVREGDSLENILSHRTEEGSLRLISGEPLMGKKVNRDEYLGFAHNVVCALFENERREAFHFLRLGRKKFSATRSYSSGFFPKKGYRFTTNQHGEKRAFVDGFVYEKVMPLQIPTMQLVKAILAKDYDLAVDLGLLEVAEEDFSLPSFVCPSKIEMVEIVKNGLREYAELYLPS